MTSHSPRLPWTLAAITGALLFAAFTAWGGSPSEDRLSLFWAQAALLFAVLCGFALLFWHLMLRPLAPGLRPPQRIDLPVSLRQRIALLQASGFLAIVIGGVWDEKWHRVYGLPFGEDLFWRPHLLMYFGFATVILVGFWALHHLNSKFRGNFQQRFRANRVLGCLILTAAFMSYALAADPFWHWTFGDDLVAWSIPHLIMLLGYIIALTIALFVYISTLPLGAWRRLQSLRLTDAPVLLLLACFLLMWLQLMLIDWDAALAGIPLDALGLYRPPWLLAMNVLAGALYTGLLATRLLRCVGAATLTGLLALGLRLIFIQGLAADQLQVVAWVVTLPPLLAIDLWTAYCTRRGREPGWRGAALAAAAAMLPNLYLIQRLYAFPSLELPATLLAILLTAIGMSWLCHQIASAMQRSRSAAASSPAEQPLAARALFASAGAFGGFVILFIATAVPPV